MRDKRQEAYERDMHNSHELVEERVRYSDSFYEIGDIRRCLDLQSILLVKLFCRYQKKDIIFIHLLSYRQIS